MRTGRAVAAAAVLLCGCSFLNRSVPAVGERPTAGGDVRPQIPLQVYYADLGPAEIDVSGYPPEQRKNYAVFARACARCHTLARAVNSEAESRLHWNFHLVRMRLHARLDRAEPITRAETTAILDFLEYDSRVRKTLDRKRFEEQVEELKRRNEPRLEQLLQELYDKG